MNISPQDPGEQVSANADLLHALLPELQVYIDERVTERVEQILQEKRPESLWTLQQVADFLNVSPRTVENVIADGSIRPLWIRGTRRFHPDAIKAYLRTSASSR